jgi:hypothetical protein
VLLLQSLCWYLNRSSILVLSSDWVVFFFLLSFSSSCLVSSSLTEVWQFKFDSCPQVQEISSTPPAVLLWSWLFTMHGLLPALLQAVAYHSLAVSLPAFPVICLLIVHVKISPLPFTFSVSTPSACASFQFIVYCVGGVDSVCLVALVYPRGGCGNTMLCLALTCLVC